MSALLWLVLLSGARPAATGAPSPALLEALAAGDALYQRRSDGARGGTAQAAPIEAAIVAYRRAVSAAPRSYAARLALLRAMFFRGGFCDIAPKDQVRLFEGPSGWPTRPCGCSRPTSRSRARPRGARCCGASRWPPRSTSGPRSRGANGPRRTS